MQASTGQSSANAPRRIEVVERPRSASSRSAESSSASIPARSILGLSLFVGQAFLYNAVFFTYALVLTTFYHVSAGSGRATTSLPSRSGTSSGRCSSDGSSTSSDDGS